MIDHNDYGVNDPYRAFNRGFKIVVGVLLASIFFFNAWLIYLIWWAA